jgi:hypothetical protein
MPQPFDPRRLLPKRWQLARLKHPHPFSGRWVWAGPVGDLKVTEVFNGAGVPQAVDGTVRACVLNVVNPQVQSVLSVTDDVLERYDRHADEVPTILMEAWCARATEAAYPPPELATRAKRRQWSKLH